MLIFVLAMIKTTATFSSPIKASLDDTSYFIGLMGTIYPLSETLQEFVRNHTVAFNLEKGEYLLHEGDLCNHLYFIRHGAVMAYSSSKKKKITTYISVENEFVSSLSGWMGKVPSRESVVAVEDSFIMAMHVDILNHLFETHFDFNYIFRTVISNYYLDAQERSHIVRVGNAKERYLYFLKTKPGYLERLPTDAVASLLDIKTETLLRIQKEQQDEAKRLERTQNLCKQLEAHFELSQCYKSKGLSLKKLSDEMNISSHTLSSLLNTEYGYNFKKFINSYRIKYICETLDGARDWQTYTIDTLALESGFVSRSTFYSAFKKEIGKSPMEYIEQRNQP